jgi:hypothetical protein
MTNFQLLAQLHNCWEAIKAVRNPHALVKVGEGRGKKFCEYAQVLRTFVNLINNRANWRTDVYNSHRVRDVEGVLEKKKVRVSPLAKYEERVRTCWVWKNEQTARVSRTENVMCSREWHKYTVLTRWPWRKKMVINWYNKNFNDVHVYKAVTCMNVCMYVCIYICMYIYSC